MILQLENWFLGYSQILADCRTDHETGTDGSALILCNADVDAMSAARILSYMLRNDGVSYQLLPCMGYRQLLKRIEQNRIDDLRALVLLNLGASRNLTRLFDSEPFLNPTVKVYVIDCRRPVHLANIHAGGNVVVFWDGVQHDDDVPSDGDNLSGGESSSDEEEEDEVVDDDDEGETEFVLDDEGEKEFGGDDDDATKAESVLSAIESTCDDEEQREYDGENEDDPGEESSVKRRRVGDKASERTEPSPPRDDESQTAVLDGPKQGQKPSLTPRELYVERRNRLKLYYASGSYFGSPASFVAYKVATQLRFQEVGDLLWLACIGVTDAYLHARLDVSGYTTLAMQLREYAGRLFPNDTYHRVSNAVYAEHLLGDSGSKQGLSQKSSSLTKIGFSGNGCILAETDFRFFLLRHTSLFDAMVYSDFVSTRFQLSTTRGMHKLQELLAKMGYPLEECHQQFAFMKPTLRRQLQKKIRDHAEEYCLDNFEFTSFFRVTGYQSLLSASDTSYAVSALLECATPTTSANAGGIESEEEEALITSFNIAYDALNSNAAPTVSLNGLTGEGNNLGSLVNGGTLTGNDGLGAGIRLAMSLQKSIMACAASLTERSAIARLSHFRYAYVTCSSKAQNQGVVGGRDTGKTRTSGESTTTSATRTEDDDEEDKDHIFAKPLALTRLAHYLMDWHRETGKWTGTKARPLILLAEKPRTSTYVVVGYEYPESAGDLVKNRFGKNFELAALSMDGTFRFDSFDSNVVEVNGGDAQRFLEQLHYLMDSAGSQQ
jgi:cell division control protein 45